MLTNNDGVNNAGVLGSTTTVTFSICHYTPLLEEKSFRGAILLRSPSYTLGTQDPIEIIHHHTPKQSTARLTIPAATPAATQQQNTCLAEMPMPTSMSVQKLHIKHPL